MAFEDIESDKPVDKVFHQDDKGIVGIPSRISGTDSRDDISLSNFSSYSNKKPRLTVPAGSNSTKMVASGSTSKDSATLVSTLANTSTFVPKSRNEETTSRILNNIIAPAVSDQRSGFRKSSLSFEKSAPHNLTSTQNGHDAYNPDKGTSKKTYYPRINHKISTKLKSLRIDDHKVLLGNLMEEICQSEKIGLSQNFKSEGKRDGGNQQLVEDVLFEILFSLPQEVSDSFKSEIHFSPEIPNKDKDLIENLTLYLTDLEKYNSQLKEYESNINLLEKDFDVWMSEVPKISSAGTAAISVSITV